MARTLRTLGGAYLRRIGALFFAGFAAACSNTVEGYGSSANSLKTVVLWNLLNPRTGASANPPRMIFVSAGFATGSVGLAGADTICNSDANKPANSGTYSALMVTSATRVASVTANVGDGQAGWVLRANTTYTRPDGTVIFTTNASGIYVFGPNMPASIGTTGAAIWTGLGSGWTTNTPTNCTDFTSTAPFGIYGTANMSNTSSIATGSLACTNSCSFYCVQQ